MFDGKQGKFKVKMNHTEDTANAFVLNDVCKKSHWNSLGVSKRLIVCKYPNNKRFLVFNNYYLNQEK